MKRREIDPASNQFPKCSPPSGTHINSQSWVEQRGVKEETQVTWWLTFRDSQKQQFCPLCESGVVVFKLPYRMQIFLIRFISVKTQSQPSSTWIEGNKKMEAWKSLIVNRSPLSPLRIAWWGVTVKCSRKSNRA